MIDLIINEIKYSVQSIETKINSIKNTREDMKKWIGKPIYKGCLESIEKWNKEINDHKKIIIEYSSKLSLLEIENY